MFSKQYMEDQKRNSKNKIAKRRIKNKVARKTRRSNQKRMHGK
jgi:hypothetical protein